MLGLALLFSLLVLCSPYCHSSSISSFPRRRKSALKKKGKVDSPCNKGDGRDYVIPAEAGIHASSSSFLVRVPPSFREGNENNSSSEIVSLK